MKEIFLPSGDLQNAITRSVFILHQKWNQFWKLQKILHTYSWYQNKKEHIKFWLPVARNRQYSSCFIRPVWNRQYSSCFIHIHWWQKLDFLILNLVFKVTLYAGSCETGAGTPASAIFTRDRNFPTIKFEKSNV